MRKSLKVNRNLLVELIKKTTDGHIKYKLGAKISLGADSSTIKAIDCSGYVRWLLYRISGHDIGDGSWNQRRVIDEDGFQHCNYADCAKMDDKLRIAFINPSDGKAGHVWLVINGMTLESYSKNGPGRRPWNNRTLKTKVDYCFVLTDDM